MDHQISGENNQLGFDIDILHFRKEGGGVWMRVPYWVYRVRNIFVSPPLIFAFFSRSYEIEAHGIVWPLATSIVLVGVLIRIWAQQHLHYRLKEHKQLTMTGPYGFVRNPLYVGNTMMCVGATVASGLLWLIPITFFWCIGTYSIVIHYEEKHLLEKYGEAYRQYLSKVARWFPKRPGLKNMGLINESLYSTMLVELPGVFILLPYVIKEFLWI